MSEIGTVRASKRVVNHDAALSALPTETLASAGPAPAGSAERATGSTRSPLARRRARRQEAQDHVMVAYQQHYGDLLRFARFVAPEPAASEDLVHEAFVKLYGAWHRIDDPAKVGGYLRTTVLNLARGRARHLGVVRRNRPDPRPDMASAEWGAMRNDSRDRVVDALQQLSERQRACLVLRHYEDRSESEIADILDISVGSVRTHVHRGMEALGRLLAAEGPESGSHS